MVDRCEFVTALGDFLWLWLLPQIIGVARKLILSVLDKLQIAKFSSVSEKLAEIRGSLIKDWMLTNEGST